MLEGIVLFLIKVLIFVYMPFTGSLEVPAFIRIVLLVVLVLFGIVLTIREKAVFNFMVGMMSVGLVIAVIWLKGAPSLLSFVMYFFAFCAFAITYSELGKGLPLLNFLVTKLYLILLIALALMSVTSFIGFNLHVIPYTTVNLGGFDYYNYYYNPVLGYIDPRVSGNGAIGRSTTFMFEPSYLSWFLTTNYFLVDRMLRKKGMLVVICKALLFMGAMATFSTTAMLTFAAIFGLQGGLWTLRKLGLGKKGELIIVWIVFLAIPISFLLLTNASSGLLGESSSLGDRQGRMENSLLILGSSGIKELAFGHGPGYIESQAQETWKAESNQYIKLIIEQGVVFTIMIISFIVYSTRKKRYFMLANLIYLNSVVIMWTPLFGLNKLLCKWNEPETEPLLPPKRIP